MNAMSIFYSTAAKFGLALALASAAPPAFTQDLAPDVLINTVSQEVIAALNQDKDLRGNQRRIVELVKAKIVPHFNFTRMIQIAMAATGGTRRLSSRSNSPGNSRPFSSAPTPASSQLNAIRSSRSGRSVFNRATARSRLGRR